MEDLNGNGRRSWLPAVGEEFRQAGAVVGCDAGEHIAEVIEDADLVLLKSWNGQQHQEHEEIEEYEEIPVRKERIERPTYSRVKGQKQHKQEQARCDVVLNNKYPAKLIRHIII